MKLSAAEAFFPIQGKSKEEAWKEELTAMFNPNIANPRSFLCPDSKCSRLESADGSYGADIFEGKRFTYKREIYDWGLRIVESTPYSSFAYVEGRMPADGRFESFNPSIKMEFILKNYSGGTSIEIRRATKRFDASDVGKGSFFDSIVDLGDALFSSKIRTNPAQAAAEDLQFILTGKCIKGNEIKHGDIIIKRVSSYGIDF
jgi:hypothetical protein